MIFSDRERSDLRRALILALGEEEGSYWAGKLEPQAMIRRVLSCTTAVGILDSYSTLVDRHKWYDILPQMDLFEEPDRTPAADRAYDAGKQASMENQPRKPPHDPSTIQYERWMAGYADHQATLAATIGRGNPDDKDVRPRHLREREAEREISEAAGKPTH